MQNSINVLLQQWFSSQDFGIQHCGIVDSHLEEKVSTAAVQKKASKRLEREYPTVEMSTLSLTMSSFPF